MEHHDREGSTLKLLVQPEDGTAPLLAAIKSAKKSIDILIFRMELREVESALAAASERGVAVRALIAHTNRGGELRLRALETRLLAAGITVGRTAGDLLRYHGKMMIVDARRLCLLSFNFARIDIEHSRGFGIVTEYKRVVQEACKLFDADLNRQPYRSSNDTLIVSPLNSRKQLSRFIKRTRKQLLVYDPAVEDKEMLGLLRERAKAGVDVRIIGSVSSGSAGLPVAPLTSMRLHTRTMIGDERIAFVGSQSLRGLELDRRREIGIIVRDRKIVSRLVQTFAKDWAATGFDELSEALREDPHAAEEAQDPAIETLSRELTPLRTTLKKAVRQAVKRIGTDSLEERELRSTLKKVVKEAVTEAVKEMVQGD